MGKLKQHQLPMTIDEQIENLKSLGLIIENEEYMVSLLWLLEKVHMLFTNLASGTRMIT